MTNSRARPDGYQRGIQMAEAGRHEEALACVQEHLLGRPTDGQALNDAGAILYAMGRFDEAAEHLKSALKHLPEPAGETLWNLAEVYLASGRPEQALALLGRMRGAGILNVELVNRVATSLLNAGQTDLAIEAILQSFDLAPAQKVLVPIYNRVKALRPKLAFFYDFGDFRFLKDVYRFLYHRFPVKLFEGGGPQDMEAMLSWCDIAWFEWCANQLIAASRMPKRCKIVCRLHRFEAYSPWCSQVNWQNVDVLITVGNSAVVEHLQRRLPDLSKTTRLVTIPNGVDVERFHFADRPRGKNIACVSRIHEVKNYPLMLQCFHKLHSIDPQYRLFVAGPYQDDGALRQYLHCMVKELGLSESVFFQGNQQDVCAWLEDKHYMVSTSLIESQGMYILEAMARGLKPLIHTWPGCRSVYPEKYLFRTPDEFCHHVLHGPYQPQEYRQFVVERYSLTKTNGMVNDLLREMEKGLAPKAPTQAAQEQAAASALRFDEADPQGTCEKGVQDKQ